MTFYKPYRNQEVKMINKKGQKTQFCNSSNIHPLLKTKGVVYLFNVLNEQVRKLKGGKGYLGKKCRRRNQEGNTLELVCVEGLLLQQQQQQKQEEKRSLRTLLRTWPRKGIQRGATPAAAAAARRGYPESLSVGVGR